MKEVSLPLKNETKMERNKWKGKTRRLDNEKGQRYEK
jgi:hypothetical protein